MEKKTLILAVETSGRIGSVAIAAAEHLLAETTFSVPMKHSAKLLPAANNMLNQFSLKPNQLKQIYISVGPGSATGLHIAVTTAKMMNLANAAKIVTVDTLDVIAANVDDCEEDRDAPIEKIATILDAKRGQFFIAVYRKIENRWTKILPDCLMTSAAFLDKFAHSSEPIWLLGEGLLYYTDAFKADGIRFLDKQFWNPRAAKLHLLGWQKALAGQFENPLTLKPFYLRNPDAEQKHPQ